MTRQTHSNCFDTELREAYAAGNLDAHSAAELERHMATCPDCARGVGLLLEEAAQEAHGTASAHGAAWRREHAMLVAAAGAVGEVQLALRRWLERGTSAAAAGVRAVRRGAGSLSEWIPEGFEPIGPVPAVAGVQVRGAIRTRGAASRPQPGGTIEIPLGDGRTARCSLEGADVVVRYPPLPRESAAPVILVIPDAGEPFAKLAELDADRYCYVARAPAPTGSFRVRLGPV
jgi:hypothetical protein